MGKRIRRIRFYKHPIFGDLEFNFTDKNGNAVDTVIIAGENGTGKSTLLNSIFKMVDGKIDFEADLEIEDKQEVLILRFRRNKINDLVYAIDNTGIQHFPSSTKYTETFGLNVIFSDVDINFNSPDITNVTSMSLDSSNTNLRSDTNLPKQVKQLLVDIQALDDANISKACRENPDKRVSELEIQERIPRFTNAFNFMFQDLIYDSIANENEHKVIYFTKNGEKIPIDKLSSGEKQIVYRGCFMLKDVDALNGAFVLIDEPEISLHPKWQKTILEYYKRIFTDEKTGVQTSQLFIVTHSPFIIHNENRKNDKVLVLARTNNGGLSIIDKPEYYRCDSIEVVEDAFCIRDFSDETATVFLEGRTDEKYFKRALEVFGYRNISVEFRWVGYMDEHNQEVNTGSDSLNKAYQFLSGYKPTSHKICLFDCDTKRNEVDNETVHIRVIKVYENSKGIKRGIENALVLDKIEMSSFYREKVKEDEYGAKSRIMEFQKMEFCDYICSLSTDDLQDVFSNLKTVIDEMISICEQ